eukprot:11687147-Ditylum_brightwellii.AAC.1
MAAENGEERQMGGDGGEDGEATESEAMASQDLVVDDSQEEEEEEEGGEVEERSTMVIGDGPGGTTL